MTGPQGNARPMPEDHQHETSYRAQFCENHYERFIQAGGNEVRFKSFPPGLRTCDVDDCKKTVAFKERDFKSES